VTTRAESRLIGRSAYYFR